MITSDRTTRDRSLDTLLLDGEAFAIDKVGKLWVKFDVKWVGISMHRTHGIKYSLTLHDENGERLLGFDNAHPIKEGNSPGAQIRIEYDHKHRNERVRFYLFTDAATLLADFWKEVELILQERSH